MIIHGNRIWRFSANPPICLLSRIMMCRPQLILRYYDIIIRCNFSNEIEDLKIKYETIHINKNNVVMHINYK